MKHVKKTKKITWFTWKSANVKIKTKHTERNPWNLAISGKTLDWITKSARQYRRQLPQYKLRFEMVRTAKIPTFQFVTLLRSIRFKESRATANSSYWGIIEAPWDVRESQLPTHSRRRFTNFQARHENMLMKVIWNKRKRTQKQNKRA